MTETDKPTDQDVLRFILGRIESVPHLEALLLIWDSRPKAWSVGEVAERLYVESDIARILLQDLIRQNLIANPPDSPDQYFYESRSPGSDAIVAAVQAKYRVEIVAISTMIHRKASLAVRDFAEAFRFTKERS